MKAKLSTDLYGERSSRSRLLYLKDGGIRCYANQGFLLVEIMVAVMLLGLLVAPLAGVLQAAADRARMARDRAASLAPGQASFPTLDGLSNQGWRWGPQVLAARWEPGPLLELSCAGVKGTDITTQGRLYVGIWVDGWFEGEHVAGEHGVLRVAGDVWEEKAGSEMIVRVRLEEGAWGPPWRTIVPDLGDDSAPPALGPFEVDRTSKDLDGTETLIHTPGLGNPPVYAAPGIDQVETDELGAVLIVRSILPGCVELALGDLPQSWLAGEGRSVDLYF